MSMNMWRINRVVSFALALGLVAVMQGCGGGGGDPGTPVLSSGGGSSSTTSGVLTLTASSTTVSSASPAQITAVLKDGKGNPVAGQVVTFKVVRSLAVTGVSTALTNANGEASTTVSPASSTITGADEITASVTYAGKLLEQTVGLQFNAANSGVLTLTASSSAVSEASPAQIIAVLRDSAGNPVAGQVVTFKALRSLAATGVSTALTNANGEASTTVSPASSASDGADEVTASVTYAGRLLEKTTGFQINASNAGVLTLTASSTTVSSASPAQIRAVLKDARGNPVAGQVVTFKVVRSLAMTGVPTALTNANGEAFTTVTPAAYTSKGADEVTASVSYGGRVLEKTVGFQFNATDITLAFGALPGGFNLSAYGQTSLVLNATGASVGSPVSVTLTSACVTSGKATISPSTATMTSGSLTVQYQDSGCGALQASDAVQAAVPASASTASLTVPLTMPSVSSLGFVTASPEQIYLKGSGLGESSLVTFVVRDSAGNALPNQNVSLSLLTGAGGVTMEDQPVGTAVSRTSDAQGRVSVRINSGTVPTPVRVQASLTVGVGFGATTVSTVSSNLSVAVGLPSQLNFSLSQQTINIEGFNIDGTTNTYNIIAADRSGNPVPAGTTINFRAEGGQIQASAQTQIVSGIARTSVNFVSAQPKPADGRVTITAYALGEESFEDLNGNNVYDPGEPFQDLGNIFFDRRFNGVYEAGEDEFLSLGISGSSACVAPANSRLALGVDIPSRPGTCEGVWSGAGQVYVRRATETVMSTSAARPLWASTGGSSGNRGLSASCQTVALQPGSDPATALNYPRVAGDTWYTGSSASDSLVLIVADANGTRLNPMAAGTTIAASTTSTGLTVTLDGGSPVPSTSEASIAGLSFNFEAGTTSGLITVRFTSPSGTTSSVAIPVVNGNRPSICAP